METEIKLAPVLRHQAEKIFKDGLFEAFPERAVLMNATYLDTEDGALRARGFSFRRRTEGKDTVFCLKGGRRGISRREIEVRGTDLDAAIEEICRSPELPLETGALLLSRKLVPVFSSRFTRRLKLVKYGGSEIEICFDEGELENGGRFSAISEFELELKSGSEDDLRALSGLICEKYGLSVSEKTKAARAGALTEDAFSKMRRVNPFFIASEMLNYCIKCGYVAYDIGGDGKLGYVLTGEGEKALPERFGIDPDKPCAKAE